MRADVWSPLLNEALESLRTMDPERLEKAQNNIEAAARIFPPTHESADKLRLVRAAAVHAATLWHTGLPQQGYSPAGVLEQEEAGAICVTG